MNLSQLSPSEIHLIILHRLHTHFENALKDTFNIVSWNKDRTPNTPDFVLKNIHANNDVIVKVIAPGGNFVSLSAVPLVESIHKQFEKATMVVLSLSDFNPSIKAMMEDTPRKITIIEAKNDDEHLANLVTTTINNTLA